MLEQSTLKLTIILSEGKYYVRILLLVTYPQQINVLRFLQGTHIIQIFISQRQTHGHSTSHMFEGGR